MAKNQKPTAVFPNGYVQLNFKCPTEIAEALAKKARDGHRPKVRELVARLELSFKDYPKLP